MQKLAREYLDELNKRHKKNRRALVAWILMAVLVVGGVMGTLAQYGVAFEGNADCGLEEHTHGDGCYTETLELTCDLAEGEDHTHGDGCYKVSKELICGLEEHTHGDSCRSAQPEAGDPAEPEKTAPSEGNGTSDVPETPPAVTDKDTDTENPQNPPADTEDEANPEDTKNPPADPDDGADTGDVQNPSAGTENGAEESPVPDDSTETGTVSGNDVAALSPPFIGDYEDGQIIIHVTADEGVIPKGAELKVVPVVKQDVEELEGKRSVEKEKIEEVKAINEKYDAAAEKLEELVAEDDTKNIAGFLAYDISFIVTDEDGEVIEVEPNSEIGNVSVKMKFVEAFLPVELADQENVQIDSVDVVHMKEDGKELKAEVLENAEVRTTENAEVEQAEFEVDSFSMFMITWNGSFPAALIYYMDYDAGNIELRPSNEPDEPDLGKALTLAEGKVFEIEDIAEGKEWEKYYKAKFTNDGVAEIKYSEKYFVCAKRYEQGLAGANVVQIRMSGTELQWKEEGNDNWQTSEDPRFAFYYSNEPREIEPLTTIDTVDNRMYGVHVFMTNYQQGEEIHNKIGGKYYNGVVRQGLVNDALKDGYPVTTGIELPCDDGGKCKGEANKSLGEWFNNETTTEVTGLFRKDKFLENNTFYYSCFENYAYLNGNTFEVYDQIGTPGKAASDDAMDRFWAKRGNFFPYNKIIAGKFASGFTNQYDEYGHVLPDSDPRKDEKLYQLDGTPDYHFSMYLVTNFIQEKNGEYKGRPMIYEFNGDDDLWVFIDDKLVLDIGGVHDAQSGSINFKTGEVSVNGGEGKNLKTIFGLSGNTFDDGTEHTLKMFYMERNGSNSGASNLKISFNLPVVGEDQVKVTKQLSNTDQEKYANVGFKFKMHAQTPADNYMDQNPTFKENEYDVLRNAITDTGETIQFDEDGTFTLKPGESAIFSGLKNNRKYYVEELGVETGKYSDVIINQTSYKTMDENKNLSGETIAVRTSTETVDKRKAVIFTNECSDVNSNELQIKKEMPNVQNGTGPFEFNVKLNNQSGDLVLYEGSYYLRDTEGNYYQYANIDEGGKPTTGVNGIVQLNSVASGTVCGTISDGKIYVPVGYTAVITGLVDGTQYLVEENVQNLSSDEYESPTIAVNSVSVEGTQATGQIGDEDTLVTVTNHLKDEKVFYQWELVKRSSSNPGAYLQGAEFDLISETAKYHGTSDDSGVVIWKDEDGNVIGNIPAGTYTLSETKTPGEEYAKVNGLWTVTLIDNERPTITAQKDDDAKIALSKYPSLEESTDKEIKVTFYIANEIFYELPSTGGSGIYRYMISGVLLMLAGVLILYNNKRARRCAGV